MIKESVLISEVVLYAFTIYYSWDNRQCPDERGDLISEILNGEVPCTAYQCHDVHKSTALV